MKIQSFSRIALLGGHCFPVFLFMALLTGRSAEAGYAAYGSAYTFAEGGVVDLQGIGQEEENSHSNAGEGYRHAESHWLGCIGNPHCITNAAGAAYAQAETAVDPVARTIQVQAYPRNSGLGPTYDWRTMPNGDHWPWIFHNWFGDASAGGYMANLYTVGAGTSGLQPGDPVDLTFDMQVDGSVTLSYPDGGESPDYNWEAASQVFRISDPSQLVFDGERENLYDFVTNCFCSFSLLVQRRWLRKKSYFPSPGGLPVRCTQTGRGSSLL